MDFPTSVRTCLSKYATFAGRASPSEFWFYFLFLTGLALILYAAEADTLMPLLALASLLPYLAACVRRLHDTDRSGWWLLIQFVPVIGQVLLHVLLAQPGTEGPNRFGDDPLDTPNVGAG